jgi:endo-1,4-beta-xylanase
MFLRAFIIAMVLPVMPCLGQRATTMPLTLKGSWGKTFDIGAAVPADGLSNAEELLLRTQFTTITPENGMKAQFTEPRENSFNFNLADKTLELAERNHLKINGHTLVWHNQTPDWFFKDQNLPAKGDLVLKRLKNHITTEVTRYRGKVDTWDVVNEVISDKPQEYLRKSKWLNAIGDSYIAQAFITAHAGDPDAKLYLNDYDIETPGKREKALRLVRELQKQRVPIDGVGIQGHWALDDVHYADIEDAIVAFHALGVKVAISELDLDVVPRATTGADITARDTVLDDPYVNGCPRSVLERQAAQYARLFAIFAKHSDAISRVTFWGLHDGRSWLNTWPHKRSNFALLFSRDLQPKPALAAVCEQAIK